jgi:hypothetical protein
LLLYRGRSPATREGIATTLAALRQEHKDAANSLNELQAAASPDVACISSASGYVQLVITELELSLASRGGGVDRAESLLPLLQRAQRLLLAASDDNAGLTMVGFSHACCCAALPRRQTEF